MNKKAGIGGTVVVGGVLAYLLIFGRGHGLGGGGLGIMPGSGTGQQAAAEADKEAAGEDSAAEAKEEAAEEAREEKAEAEVEETSEEKEIPDNIIVEITDDKVTINGEPVKDAGELREKVNEYMSDTRTFELVENHAILATYNWVRDTFNELEIFLKESGD